jgi:hypothetical protein
MSHRAIPSTRAPHQTTRTAPEDTPLQVDFDGIIKRLMPGMREGCLPQIARVRTALDGTPQIAIEQLKSELQALSTAAEATGRELTTARSVVEEIRAVLKADSKAGDKLKAIAEMVDPPKPPDELQKR